MKYYRGEGPSDWEAKAAFGGTSGGTSNANKLFCKHCGSSEGYYKMATTKSEASFYWTDIPENNVVLSVTYGKTIRCSSCHKKC